MHPTALPAGTKDAGDSEAQAVMSIRDHQLDALEPALDQALQKARPERLGLRGANTKPDDLAATATAIIAATETMQPPSRTFR